VNLLDFQNGSAFIAVSQKCVQFVAMAFQCQACKGPAQMFLIRRAGFRVSIEGRSPIEKVQRHPDLPEPYSVFFADSVLAFQCGQVLPAVCMLRVFIEQFVRSRARNARWDVAIETYAASLPTEFRARFGTLSEQYGELSEAIHDAQVDAAQYERIRWSVEKHFVGRRAFDI